jgi:peptide/nickel transport system permease protein
MMRRFLKLRSVRKFRRNHLAMAALLVIVAYLLTAAAAGVGISESDTSLRVGAKNVPGFFLNERPELRIEDSVEMLDTIDRALKVRRADRRLPAAERERRVISRVRDVRYGRRRVADKPLDELREMVDGAYVLYDRLAETEDLDEHPELTPQIEQFEKHVLELLPWPTGWNGIVQDFLLLMGTDMQGRSIALRAVYSIQIAIQIGLVTALISVLIGSLLGAAAGFFGGWVDSTITWLFTTFSSIPYLVLLVLLAYMFTGTILEGTLWPIYIAFSVTYWIGPCRVIRGETLKLKQLEYVEAATAIGFSRPYIMVRHILPNASHLMLINFSLLFIGAIKAEVILTYLGLGLKQGASWGLMIDQSRSEVLNGFFWQIGTATALMFGLVLAFNILSDALQDVFDPKHL